jgi:hypothetical protein
MPLSVVLSLLSGISLHPTGVATANSNAIYGAFYILSPLNDVLS